MKKKTVESSINRYLIWFHRIVIRFPLDPFYFSFSTVFSFRFSIRKKRSLLKNIYLTAFKLMHCVRLYVVCMAKRWPSFAGLDSDVWRFCYVQMMSHVRELQNRASHTWSYQESIAWERDSTDEKWCRAKVWFGQCDAWLPAHDAKEITMLFPSVFQIKSSMPMNRADISI